MKWTGLNDLRESYLSFFESKGHLRLNSFPLVPQGDNSVLLINAGMTPLKKYFQGIEEPPRHRVTTCQKCIRTPDIENVGKTARHGTYFEMLGNFSFGDYFKHEAIAWAWEYLTKVLEIPPERLWVTIYEQDDEAGDIWANEVGVPRERIIKLGKADNFWEHGWHRTGPERQAGAVRGLRHRTAKSGSGLGTDGPGADGFLRCGAGPLPAGSGCGGASQYSQSLSADGACANAGACCDRGGLSADAAKDPAAV